MNVFCFLLFAGLASAVLNIQITEAGGNVDVAATGSLAFGTGPTVTTTLGANQIDPSVPAIANDPTLTGNFDGYVGVAPGGPTSWGTGVGTIPTTSMGDVFFLDGSTGTVAVPENYVDNTPLGFTQQYSGQDLTTMGLTPGLYTYTITGTGDTINVCVGVACPSLPIFGTE